MHMLHIDSPVCLSPFVPDIMLQEALAMRDAARENLRRQDCAISFCFWILYL